MTTEELIAELARVVANYDSHQMSHAALERECELYEAEMRRRGDPERLALEALGTEAISDTIQQKRAELTELLAGWGQVGREMRRLGGVTPRARLRVLRDPRSAVPHESLWVLGGVMPVEGDMGLSGEETAKLDEVVAAHTGEGWAAEGES